MEDFHDSREEITARKFVIREAALLSSNSKGKHLIYARMWRRERKATQVWHLLAPDSTGQHNGQGHWPAQWKAVHVYCVTDKTTKV